MVLDLVLLPPSSWRWCRVNQIIYDQDILIPEHIKRLLVASIITISSCIMTCRGVITNTRY